MKMRMAFFVLALALLASPCSAGPSAVAAWKGVEEVNVATTTVAGTVELATDAETQALTSDSVVVTPGNLGALNASETQKGLVELATVSELNSGTDTARPPSCDAIAGSVFGKKIVVIKVVDDGTAVTIGDGKARFVVPFTGFNLVSCEAHTYSPSVTQAMQFQIHNETDGNDMLSTAGSIDAGEYDTLTATVPLVIDTAKDDVVEGDVLRIDIDQVQSAAQEGLEARLGFRKP